MQKQKRFIRRKELVAKVGLCATTIYNLERTGQFPKHELITPRCAVWDEAAVDAWMAARMADPAGGSFVPKRDPAAAKAAA